MSRQVTILRVFMASPTELKSERIAIESVIRELNQMHSESTAAYLELIKWETHAVPGIGPDPQAVINEQIADNYEIFIGMLSTKFGSPTPRAGSGTEEEFQRAYERFIKTPNELRIMFYFKDPEMRASEIDIDEYKRVKDFKSRLGEKGLYATFSTTEEFVAISGLPRVTRDFNRARRHAAQSLAGLNRALSSVYNLTSETLRELKRILDE